MYNLNKDGSGRDIYVRLGAVNILEVKQRWSGSIDIAIYCGGNESPIYINNLSMNNYTAFKEALENDARTK